MNSSNKNNTNNSGATNMDGVYQDYAKEEEPSLQVLRDSFPVKLHYMLADVEKDGLDDIISWHVHGR